MRWAHRTASPRACDASMIIVTARPSRTRRFRHPPAPTDACTAREGRKDMQVVGSRKRRRVIGLVEVIRPRRRRSLGLTPLRASYSGRRGKPSSRSVRRATEPRRYSVRPSASTSKLTSAPAMEPEQPSSAATNSTCGRSGKRLRMFPARPAPGSPGPGTRPLAPHRSRRRPWRCQ